MQLRGIIPPIVTPMTADQEIDLKTLKEVIDFQLRHTVHGIFVL